MRARLVSTPKTRDDVVSKIWIRPMRPVIRPNPQDQRAEAEERVEFSFDGEALHVTGCEPLRT